MNEPPVRLCCFQRHYGAQCPDGKVMCCICFERFTLEELNKTPEGKLEDVCNACAMNEKKSHT